MTVPRDRRGGQSAIKRPTTNGPAPIPITPGHGRSCLYGALSGGLSDGLHARHGQVAEPLDRRCSSGRLDCLDRCEQLDRALHP